MSQNGPSRVAIPVKAFGMAKGRLSQAMTADQRRTLARLMAEGVVRACENLPLSIVCDDNEVAEWAESLGADVEWTPGLGLNGAVQEAMRRASERG
ncbi:MAG TPA: hypothetical protein VL068_04910, partial [Microthrixaceae bacterium]|nr:hypothetical protein [Microthrixaceae bacterium]